VPLPGAAVETFRAVRGRAGATVEAFRAVRGRA